MLSRACLLLLVACLATVPLGAQTDPFVGQWKLVTLKDQMKVTNVGANAYAFDFGGGPERIVVDGTYQPGYAGTTLSVAAEGQNWKVMRKKGNRLMLTATWTLSKDGNKLHDAFTSFGRDGSPSTVNNVYDRIAPGSRFAGTWVNATGASSALLLQVRPYQSNGLSFIIPAQHQTLNATFDGSSSRRLNARAIEIVRTSKGKVTQTREITLSPDLKTLTMTIHVAGAGVPFTYVFART